MYCHVINISRPDFLYMCTRIIDHVHYVDVHGQGISCAECAYFYIVFFTQILDVELLR